MAGNSTQTILGLSPGSRDIGVAVLQDGTLKEWRIVSIRAKTLQEKIQMLKQILNRLHRSYQLTSVAMKGIHLHPSFVQLECVTHEIQSFAHEHRLRVQIFSLTKLKNTLMVPKGEDRCFMADLIADHYPVLYSELRRRIIRNNSYSLKIFEAVAVVRASSISVPSE